MPAGLIDDQRSVSAGRDLGGDSARWRFIASVSQRGMTSAAPLPSLGRPRRRYRPRRFAGPSGARARAAFGPAARDLVLLADTRLVGEPDLYGATIDAGFAPDLLQARGKLF